MSTNFFLSSDKDSQKSPAASSPHDSVLAGGTTNSAILKVATITQLCKWLLSQNISKSTIAQVNLESLLNQILADLQARETATTLPQASHSRHLEADLQHGMAKQAEDALFPDLAPTVVEDTQVLDLLKLTPSPSSASQNLTRAHVVFMHDSGIYIALRLGAACVALARNGRRAAALGFGRIAVNLMGREMWRIVVVKYARWKQEDGEMENVKLCVWDCVGVAREARMERLADALATMARRSRLS